MNTAILHIPHSSILIPEEELDLYCMDGAALAAENLRLADLHTDELYDLPGAGRAVFPISRFCVDAERFSDDAAEPMAARGMGALYRVATDLRPIRPEIPQDRRARLFERYYWPHHRALDAMAAQRLESHGRCLIFDCHSYPSKALPYELENRPLPRPEIGIGTDRFHTPRALVEVMRRAFEERGYEVAVDTPFSGALVPNAFYGRERRVASIMTEVRKDLYMDEASGERLPGFSRVRSDLTAVMSAVEQAWRAGAGA